MVPLEQELLESETPAPVVMMSLAAPAPAPPATPRQIAEAVIRFMLKPAEPARVDDLIVDDAIEVEVGEAVPILKERAEDWDVPLDWSSPDELVEWTGDVDVRGEAPEEVLLWDRPPLPPVAPVEVPMAQASVKEAKRVEFQKVQLTVEPRPVSGVPPPPVAVKVERAPLPDVAPTPPSSIGRAARAATAPLAFAMKLRMEPGIEPAMPVPPRELVIPDAAVELAQDTEAVPETPATPVVQRVAWVEGTVRTEAPETQVTKTEAVPRDVVTAPTRAVPSTPRPEPEAAPIPAVKPVAMVADRAEASADPLVPVERPTRLRVVATHPEETPQEEGERVLSPRAAPEVSAEVTEQEPAEAVEAELTTDLAEPVEPVKPMPRLERSEAAELVRPVEHVRLPSATPEVAVVSPARPVEVRERFVSPEVSPAPATQTVEEPKAAARPSATHEIAVRVSAPDSAPVDLHVKQRGSAVHVAVRTANEGLQASLRHDLGNLVDRLQESGFHPEKVVTQELPVARVRQESLQTFDLTGSIRTHGVEQQGTNFEQSDNRRHGDSSPSSGDSHRENGARQQQQQQRRQNPSQYLKWKDAMEDQA